MNLRILLPAVVAGALLALPAAAPAASTTVVINEVDYDQPGTDTAEFLELKNVSAGTINLDPYSVQLVNGNAGGAAVYRTINLPSVDLAAGDLYVICANAANTANCDLDAPAPDIGLDPERRARCRRPAQRDHARRRAQLRGRHGRAVHGGLGCRRRGHGRGRRGRSRAAAPTRIATASTSSCAPSRRAPTTAARRRSRSAPAATDGRRDPRHPGRTAPPPPRPASSACIEGVVGRRLRRCGRPRRLLRAGGGRATPTRMRRPPRASSSPRARRSTRATSSACAAR